MVMRNGRFCVEDGDITAGNPETFGTTPGGPVLPSGPYCHKDDIKSMKVHCPICGNLVQKNGITKHQKTRICVQARTVQESLMQ